MQLGKDLRVTRFLGRWSKGRESARWGLARWGTKGEHLLFRLSRKGTYSELLNRFVWFMKSFDAMYPNVVNLHIVIFINGQDRRDSKFERTFVHSTILELYPNQQELCPQQRWFRGGVCAACSTGWRVHRWYPWCLAGPVWLASVGINRHDDHVRGVIERPKEGERVDTGDRQSNKVLAEYPLTVEVKNNMFCALASVNEDEDEEWEKQKGRNGMEAHETIGVREFDTINGNQCLRSHSHIQTARQKPWVRNH